MPSAPTLRFTAQARADIARLQAELADLQRQTASSVKSDSLKGYGEGASRLLYTNGLLAINEARSTAAEQLQVRLSLQAGALQQGGSVLTRLAGSVREAAINDDGRFLGADLELTFSNLVSALNETLNGQPLFGGERVGEPPIRISSLNELSSISQPSDLYQESSRPQRGDLGDGVTFEIGDKASEISWTAFEALRDLKRLMNSAGGQLPEGLSATQRNQLLEIAGRLEVGAQDLRASEGRTGLLSARIADAQTRLETRTAMLKNEIGRQTNSDLAEIALRLATLQTQYQATGQTFAQLARLSLLEFLR